MPKQSKTSRQWLKEHFTDPYVIEAQKKGYRSRAVFKLLEIQNKDRIIKPGACIVDLGAAPGAWSQSCTEILKGSGKIIALDILPMTALEGVEFIQGDFREEETLAKLESALNHQPIDLLLSDMAPNTSGINAVDQPRAMYLAELAMELAISHLKPKGDFLVKIFQGHGFDEYVRTARTLFNQVDIRKPKASRARSKEVYLLARNKKIR